MLLVPTLHPALLLKNGDDDGQAKFERTVIGDLQKGLRLSRSSPTWNESLIFERDGPRAKIARLGLRAPGATVDEVLQLEHGGAI
jgi:hypothetical protein